MDHNMVLSYDYAKQNVTGHFDGRAEELKR
jgi:hypothetical protein